MVGRDSDSPPVGTEWAIRYRVLGPSAVWQEMTVCEVVGGPLDREVRVLENIDFVDKLERKRKIRRTTESA